MRPPNLVEVSRGLTTVHWGFRVVVGGIVVAAVVVVLTGFVHVRYGPTVSGVIFPGMVGLGSLVVLPVVGIGTLVSMHGRVCCLDTPAEWPTACARIRLAVILEACGLGSGVVNGGLFWANGVGKITVPVEALYSVFLLAFPLVVAGRAFFYAFTEALAKAVDMKPAPLPSVVPLMLIVIGSTAVSTSVGLQLIDNSRSLTLTATLVAGGAFVVALCVFGMLYSIGRWFRRLRDAVTQFNMQSAYRANGAT